MGFGLPPGFGAGPPKAKRIPGPRPPGYPDPLAAYGTHSATDPRKLDVVCDLLLRLQVKMRVMRAADNVDAEGAGLLTSQAATLEEARRVLYKIQGLEPPG